MKLKVPAILSSPAIAAKAFSASAWERGTAIQGTKASTMMAIFIGHSLDPPTPNSICLYESYKQCIRILNLRGIWEARVNAGKGPTIILCLLGWDTPVRLFSTSIRSKYRRFTRPMDHLQCYEDHAAGLLPNIVVLSFSFPTVYNWKSFLFREWLNLFGLRGEATESPFYTLKVICYPSFSCSGEILLNRYTYEMLLSVWRIGSNTWDRSPKFSKSNTFGSTIDYHDLVSSSPLDYWEMEAAWW